MPIPVSVTVHSYVTIPSCVPIHLKYVETIPPALLYLMQLAYIFRNNWRKCRGLPYTYGYITFPATLSYLRLTPESEARCSTIVIISFASLLRSTISLESSIWPSSNLLIWRMSLISDKR